MNDRIKHSLFLYLALRMLIDLTLLVVIYQQVQSLVPSIGFGALCSVFYAFLVFGLQCGEFHGRHGHRISIWGEPIAYWCIVAFLILFHLIITGLMLHGVLDSAGLLALAIH